MKQSAALACSAGIHLLVLLPFFLLTSGEITRKKTLAIDFSYQHQAGSTMNMAATAGSPPAQEVRPETRTVSLNPPTAPAVPSEPLPAKKMAPQAKRAVSHEGQVPVAAPSEPAVVPTASVPAADAGPTGGGRQGAGVQTSGGGSSPPFGDAEEGRKTYLKEHFSFIRSIINSKRSYPKLARRMGWAGTVKISFVICADGTVNNVRVLGSSGYDVLDKNTVETVKNCSPYPKPPVAAEIVIPVAYRLE
jgi:periplasmic protein TonB